MPKALCLTGMVIAIVVLLLFSLDLILKVPFQRKPRHGFGLRAVRRDVGLYQLDDVSRARLSRGADFVSGNSQHRPSGSSLTLSASRAYQSLHRDDRDQPFVPATLNSCQNPFQARQFGLILEGREFDNEMDEAR